MAKWWNVGDGGVVALAKEELIERRLTGEEVDGAGSRGGEGEFGSAVRDQ